MTLDHPKLIVVTGPNAGQEVVLGPRPVLLGRDPECDLALNDTYASRHHCWIEQRGAAWWVRDLESKNGTWLAGERVNHEALLHHNDLLLVGHSQVRLHAPDATQTYEALPAAVAPTHTLHVSLSARQVVVNGAVVEPALSPKQWALLAVLVQRRGEVVTKDEIGQAVWPEAAGAIYDYQIDKLVSRLRERLGAAGDTLIETHWGTGYRLKT